MNTLLISSEFITEEDISSDPNTAIHSIHSSPQLAALTRNWIWVNVDCVNCWMENRGGVKYQCGRSVVPNAAEGGVG